MEIDDIRKLVELLNNTDISELNLETEDVKIRIKKATASSPPPIGSTPGSTAPDTPTVQTQPVDESGEEDGLIEVPAPMVGTFYRAPDPQADPYVKEGELVQVGQPLCIIEAMKLMNEIESEVKGHVVRVLVDDGEPVEYGEPLFLIRPEG